MNRFALFVVLTALSLSLYGQSGQESDPIALTPGSVVNVDFSAASSVYYSYTPQTPQMMTFGDMQNVNIYAYQVTPEDKRYGDSFNGVTYVQTQAGVTYTVRVDKGFLTTAASFKFDTYECAWPQGESWSAPIVPGDKFCYVPGFYNGTTYLKYTAAEEGVLQLFFTASPTLEWSTSTGGTFSKVKFDYVDGGGFKSYIDVAANTTYYFKYTGNSAMCRFEVIHPVTGESPDFPYTVPANGSGTFPKAKGTYYYKILNNESNGYLLVEGNGAFDGEVSLGNSFTTTVPEVSTDRIHLRMSVTQYYDAYYLTLRRDTDAAADQTFTTAYSTEDYDIFPGKSIDAGSYVTPDFAGLYYYTFTVPGDGNNIINLNISGEPKDETSALSLYFADNQYTQLANGKSIKFEAQAGRAYTVAVRVGPADIPLTFSLQFMAPEAGTSPNNPLPAVLGENSYDGTGIVYFKYTATMDGWLYVTPGAGCGQPSVSMLPIPSDPYTQACEVIADGDSYRVATTNARGYLIVFTANGAMSFKLSEQQALPGESPVTPLAIEGTEVTLPSDPGIYWYKYVSPSSGKLEISTDLAYIVSNNKQDYTYVRIYRPTDPDNFISELRPNLDDNTFVNRVLNTLEGDEYLLKVRILQPGTEATLSLEIRDPKEGETPDKPVVIPFIGNSGTYEFADLVNDPAYGVWYSIDLPAGLFTMQGTSRGTFEADFYAAADPRTPLARTDKLGVDYDEVNSMYIYTWGIANYRIEAPGEYLLYVSDNEVSFEVTLTVDSDAAIDAVGDGIVRIAAVSGGLDVEADDALLQVYRIDGVQADMRRVNGRDYVALPTGIYVVRLGATVTKVAIR